MTLNRAAWDGILPPVVPKNIWGEDIDPEAPTPLVQPGDRIASRTRGWGGMGLDGRPEDPVWGIVYEVVPGLDTGTGEVETRYLIIGPTRGNWGHLHHDTLLADDADSASIDTRPGKMVDVAWDAIRSLAESVARTSAGGRKRGRGTPADRDAVRLQWRLVQVLTDRGAV